MLISLYIFPSCPTGRNQERKLQLQVKSHEIGLLSTEKVPKQNLVLVPVQNSNESSRIWFAFLAKVQKFWSKFPTVTNFVFSGRFRFT